jgi:histone H3/H4
LTVEYRDASLETEVFDGWFGEDFTGHAFTRTKKINLLNQMPAAKTSKPVSFINAITYTLRAQRSSNEAKLAVNKFLVVLGSAIAEKSRELMVGAHKKTISAIHVLNAARLISGNQDAGDVGRATVHIKKFQASVRVARAKKETSANKAGLTFSPARAMKLLEVYSLRKSALAAVALAAVLEMYAEEIAKFLAGRKKTAKVADVYDALAALFSNTCKSIKFSLHRVVVRDAPEDLKHQQVRHKTSLKIARAQKAKECTRLPRAHIEREVRAALPNGTHVTADAFKAIHVYVENRMVDYLRKGGLIAKAQGRKTLLDRDVALLEDLGL